MRVLTLRISACALALLASCATQSIDARAEQELAGLAWLAGMWTCESAPGEVVEESWGHARGGWMLGVGRTLRVDEAGERVVAFEYLRIESRPEGVVYVAQPGGRSPGTEFRLVECAADTWTFENPAHDFPRVVRYRREGDTCFTATLSGSEGGKPLQLELEYRRTGH